MDGERKLPLSHAPKKTRSEARQKQRRITFRLTADELDTLEKAAGAAQVTLGSYIRETMLTTPQTRSRRRPSADVAMLAKLIAELNRVGGNINQIARAANFGEQPESAWLRDVLATLLHTMKNVRAAMGFES